MMDLSGCRPALIAEERDIMSTYARKKNICLQVIAWMREGGRTRWVTTAEVARATGIAAAGIRQAATAFPSMLHSSSDGRKWICLHEHLGGDRSFEPSYHYDDHGAYMASLDAIRKEEPK